MEVAIIELGISSVRNTDKKEFIILSKIIGKGEIESARKRKLTNEINTEESFGISGVSKESVA